MDVIHSSDSLVRWSWVLMAAGALLFSVAILCLAVVIWHVAQLGGDGPTYVAISPWPAAVVILASLAAVGSATFIWRRSGSATLARRLSLAAIIATAAAWVAFGAALLVLAQGSGAA